MAAGLAVVLTAFPAMSATPGSPAAPIAAGCFPQIFETRGITESQTVDLNRVPALNGVGVCDGYVVMVEPLDDGGVAALDAGSPSWSDVVVFHDGTGLPSGQCGPAVHFATIISDGMFPERTFPASGPLLRLPDGGVAPDGGVPLDYLGLPQNLVGLTVETVQAVTANPTVFSSEVTLPVGSIGLRHPAGPSTDDAGVGSGTACTYTLFSDLPALPIWAFGILGTTLLGAAVVVMRRARGQSGTLA